MEPWRAARPLGTGESGHRNARRSPLTRTSAASVTPARAAATTPRSTGGDASAVRGRWGRPNWSERALGAITASGGIGGKPSHKRELRRFQPLITESPATERGDIAGRAVSRRRARGKSQGLAGSPRHGPARQTSWRVLRGVKDVRERDPTRPGAFHGNTRGGVA